MKKTVSLLIVLSVLIALLASCTVPDSSGEVKDPVQLDAPVVTLSGNTASWLPVEGASGYELGINIAISKHGVGKLSHELENGESLMVRAIGDGVYYSTSKWSNLVSYSDGSGQGGGSVSSQKLGTPVVTLSGDTASWGAIEGALRYEINVLYGGQMRTEFCSADVLSRVLLDGEQINVRAVGDGAEFKNGDWSAPVKYVAPTVPGGDGGSGDGDGGGDSQVCVHYDSDDNGDCDSCGISLIVVIDFYAINDMHGKFCDSDTQPGVDELATYLKSREQVDDNVVVLSSGDMWQGAAESNLTYGKLITEWMNIVGTVSMTLGNHEFDWGESYIRDNLEVANFPFLAINIYDRSTGERADYCTPSIMIDEGGIQVGIIGAIGDCYSSILKDMVTGVEFKVGSELTSLVKNESDRLRAAGADIIVYSLHDGTSGYDNALSHGYVDLVFEGHTHASYATRDAYGVYHIQGGDYNDGISHAEIGINSVTGTLSVSVAEVIYNSEYLHYSDDPETEALAEKYGEIIRIANEVLGTNTVMRGDSEVEDLVAMLYYQAGVEKWGARYNITLGGGFLKTREPYHLAAGEVTYGELLEILPFNNQIVLCSVSGANLLDQFINTNNGDYHIYTTVDKNTISRTGTYYIVVDSYTSAYAKNGLTPIESYDETTFARDLLAEYIRGGNLGTESSYTLTSLADFIAECKSMTPDEVSTKKYYLKGRITSVISSYYGNVYIEDDAGNSVYVYGMYDTNGVRYGQMSDPPTVGDTVILCGSMQYYGGTKVELVSSTIIEIE